jgi:preprotein translocase subunit SecB
MAETQQPQQINFQFFGVDFPIVNFQSQKPFDRKGEIQSDLKPRVMFTDDDSGRFQVVLDVHLKVEEYFELTVRGIGKFALPKEIDLNDEIRAAISKSASNMMFPFVRSFVNTFTTNLGTPTGPLMLPPQFFGGAKRSDAQQ